MISRDALIAPHVQAFFAEHLAQHKRVSPQTIVSYRDTFRLFLTFIKETTGRNPRLCMSSTSTRPLSCNFSTIWNTNAAMPSAHGTCVWRRSVPLRGSSPCEPLRFSHRDPRAGHPGQTGRQKADWVSHAGRSRGAPGGSRSFLLEWAS